MKNSGTVFLEILLSPSEPDDFLLDGVVEDQLCYDDEGEGEATLQ